MPSTSNYFTHHYYELSGCDLNKRSRANRGRRDDHGLIAIRHIDMAM